MSKRLFLLVVIAALLVAASPVNVGAQDENIARVRIGYFAFDPHDVDTFIDGEPAPFGVGWTKTPWNVSTIPDFPYMLTSATTPYIAFPAGVHSFAFVPQGEGVDAAILGPQEVTFEAGHVYSLAIVGYLDNHDLKVLVIDETEAFSEANPSTDFMGIIVHNIQGAPSLAYHSGTVAVENLEYNQFSADASRAGYPSVRVTPSEDPGIALFGFEAISAPGVSDLSCLIGSYPGKAGEDYFWSWNWGYPGEITVMDGGTVAVGDEIAGEIAERAQRVRYTLTIDADTAVNIYLHARGTRKNSWGSGWFDPYLYVYDAQGNLLFWNDELTFADDFSGKQDTYDASLEGVTLETGSYIVEAAGSSDIIAGPYMLAIENVATE